MTGGFHGITRQLSCAVQHISAGLPAGHPGGYNVVLSNVTGHVISVN